MAIRSEKVSPAPPGGPCALRPHCELEKGWIEERVAQVPQWRDGWGGMGYGLLGSLRGEPHTSEG